MKSLPSLICIKLIEFYQIFLSFDRGLLMVFAPGGACRYEVSCSEFMKREIREIGAIRGVLRGVQRILSCK